MTSPDPVTRHEFDQFKNQIQQDLEALGEVLAGIEVNLKKLLKQAQDAEAREEVEEENAQLRKTLAERELDDLRQKYALLEAESHSLQQTVTALSDQVKAHEDTISTGKWLGGIFVVQVIVLVFYWLRGLPALLASNS